MYFLVSHFVSQVTLSLFLEVAQTYIFIFPDYSSSPSSVDISGSILGGSDQLIFLLEHTEKKYELILLVFNRARPYHYLRDDVSKPEPTTGHWSSVGSGGGLQDQYRDRCC